MSTIVLFCRINFLDKISDKIYHLLNRSVNYDKYYQKINKELTIIGDKFMNDTLKSALISAAIPTIGSFVIFFLGDFHTKSSLERDTVATLSEYFDEVDKDMEYEKALKTAYDQYKEATNEIENLTSQLENQQIEIDQQNSKEEIEKIIQSATEYGNNSDFVQALTLLNSISNKTTKIETLMNNYTKKYENQIIAEANEYINKEEYEEAINIITDALKLIPNDSVLKQKIEDIQNSKPQNLLNAVIPYETHGYTEKTADGYMKMGGEKYYNGFQLGKGLVPSFAIFNLNSKYMQVTGFIGHIDESGDANKTVTIYTDGILIETININYQDLPKEFVIDVTGVNQLKFERSDGETQTGFGNLYIK